MLWGMRPLVFLLFTSMALAQPGEDARPLLRQVSDAARNVRSWRAEYVATIETTGEGFRSKREMPTKETAQGPNLLRREMTPTGTPILIICDGVNTWDYTPALKQYQKTLGARAACSSHFSNWARLMDGIQSAVITGSDTVVFEGIPTPCDLVRAEYGTLTMTVCVDRNRSLILRETSEAKAVSNPSPPKVAQSKTTISYSSIERDPVLPPDFFTFEPPAGSTLLAPTGSPPAQRVDPGPFPPGVYRIGNGVTAPVLISKVEPKYTRTARAAKIEGIVVLSFYVDAEGVLRDLRVIQSLDPDLDQNAINAVSKWRFRPGMRDGQPVAVAVKVEVNFRF
jgi:TonB family protein